MIEGEETIDDLFEMVRLAKNAFRAARGEWPELLLLGAAWARTFRRNDYEPIDVHAVAKIDHVAWFWGHIYGIKVYTLNDGKSTHGS